MLTKGEVVYNQRHCIVTVHPAPLCVRLEWHGYARSDEFREACNASLEAMSKAGATAMVADNSQAKVVGDPDIAWMQTDWFPRAFSAGFRLSAVVVAKDVFRQMALKAIDNKLDKTQLNVRYFDDNEQAFAWLESALGASSGANL